MAGYSVVKVAALNCDQKVIGACKGSNLRSCWWQAFWIWLVQRSPEAADGYRRAKTAAAQVVAEAKIWMWEEFWRNSAK